jgi:hypothetical protein
MVFHIFALFGKKRHTPPPVFLQKSVELLKNKGVDAFGNDKEFATV